MLTILPKIVTDGLVLYLDAANPFSYPGSGDTWFDLTRYRNNGTFFNGATYDPLGGGSIAFDGVDSSVRCPNSDSLAITSDITLAVWTNVTNFNNYRGLISKTNGALPYPYDFYINNISSPYGGPASAPQALVGKDFDFVYGASGTVITTGVWNNIVVVIQYNISSNTTTFNHYLNGILVASPAWNRIPVVSNNVNKSLFIGNRDDNGTPMLGYIAVAKIYNRALTSQEVLQNYNALKYRFGL